MARIEKGKQISLRASVHEHDLLIEWMNAQSNLMDSFRILIENEVMAHGIRNLQEHYPPLRNFLNSTSTSPDMIHQTVEELSTTVEIIKPIAVKDVQDISSGHPTKPINDHKDSEPVSFKSGFKYDPTLEDEW